MTSSEENLNDYVGAYTNDFPYADDNKGVLTAYAKKIVDSSNKFNHNLDICSLGIGYETVSRAIESSLANKINSYTIVEGSEDLISSYKSNPLTFQRNVPINLVHDRFETFEPNTQFDLIEMGFVLEHVDDPLELVHQYAKYLKPDGLICAAVPNALSMHRVLGHRANLLKDMYALSEWDHKLGHKRYYDKEKFIDVFQTNDLQISSFTGLMLKPLSTSQMNVLNLSQDVWTAFYSSGDLAPDFAYGLYVEARQNR